MRNVGLPLTIAAAVLLGTVIHALGQTRASRPAPWLEPYTPTRLEWLALQKQAMEGRNDLGEDGIGVHFYLSPDSLRTGEIWCDLEYRPSTQAQAVQLFEDEILTRFEATRQLYPWARVKIIKKVVKTN